jgi:hypothetical protein
LRERDLTPQLDTFGNIGVDVTIGGGPGAAERVTGASGDPLAVAAFLTDLADDVAALAEPKVAGSPRR